MNSQGVVFPSQVEPSSLAKSEPALVQEQDAPKKNIHIYTLDYVGVDIPNPDFGA